MHHTSQSLYLTAPYTLEWQTETLPDLGAHDVLLKTLAGSISIGTELAQYRGDERSVEPMTYPRMTGYESYARVIAVGESVTKVKIDDTVFAFYGHRTYELLHEDYIYSVPKSVAVTNALSAILTCDVAKGIRKLNPSPETRCLITGGGAIGLLSLLMLKAYGVIYVDVVEPLLPRRKLAQDFGATHVYTPNDAIDNTYDVALECSSRQSAFALLQTHVNPHGRICILADGNIEPLILLPEFHQKELTIIGSSDGWDYHRHSKWFFDYIQQYHPPLPRLFDLHINHTDLPDAFAQLADGSLSAIKVLVRYN